MSTADRQTYEQLWAGHPAWVSSDKIYTKDSHGSTFICYLVSYKSTPDYDGGNFLEVYRDDCYVDDTDFVEGFDWIPWFNQVIHDECGDPDMGYETDSDDD